MNTLFTSYMKLFAFGLSNNPFNRPIHMLG